MRIGLLDQSIVYEEETAQSTLAKTVSYAKKADQLGFDAFYVSEHHLIDQMAGVSPEVLMGYLLAATSTIKIGSAGVMLQHFVPYKVAENIDVLANLAPDRVIVGVGKAQGGNDQVVKVLQRDAFQKERPFDEKYREFVGLIRDELPPEHPYYETITLQPVIDTKPEMVLLGGSLESVALAHETTSGMIYPFFANGDRDALHTIKSAFQKGSAQRFMVAVTVALVSSEVEKRAYLEQLASYTVHFISGKRLNFADETSAKAYQASQSKETWIEMKSIGAIVGTKETLAKALQEFTEYYQITDLVLHTPHQPYAQKEQLIDYLATKIELKRGVFL